MKYNHTKAQELLIHKIEPEELHGIKDKVNSFIKVQIGEDINKIASCALNIGKRFAGTNLEGEDLKTDIISIIESIHEILPKTNQEQCEQLFENALNNILYGLRQDQFDSVIGDIEEIYDL